MLSICVGIVGAGANTCAKHIPGLRAVETVEIVSVANRSRESAERVARQFGIPKVYTFWEDLVTAEDTNAIVIGSWPYLHCKVTEAALKAGKHVLCEARMAMDGAEARHMLKVAKDHPHLVTQLVPSPFTLRVDPMVRRLIDSGYLGDILVATVRETPGTFLDKEGPLHWRQDRRRSGLNVLSLGPWYESMVRWVGEAREVFAVGQIFVTERYDAETGQKRKILVPDHIGVLAEMLCGAQSHFEFSSVTGLAPASEVWIFGSDGTIHYDAGRDILFGGRRGEPELQVIKIPSEQEGRWRVEEEFVNAIRHLEPVRLTTFEDGVKYMEFTQAVARSLESGCKVRVGELYSQERA